MLHDYLSKEELQYFAGPIIYQRGKRYFEQGRVNLLEADPFSISGHVHGSYLYQVSIWLNTNTNGIKTSCSCPHAHQGYFCKHLVAIALAAIEAFKDQTFSIWQNQLEYFSDTFEELKNVQKSKPYYLFFSLQNRPGWAIYPYLLKEQLAEDLKQSLFNPLQIEQAANWITQNYDLKDAAYNLDTTACINFPPEIASFAQLLAKVKRLNTGPAYTYYGRYTNDSYYPLADLLQVVADKHIPLFLGSSNHPLKKLAQIHTVPAEPVMEITEAETGIQVEHYYQSDGKKLSGTYETLTNSPIQPWLKAGKQIFPIQGNLKDPDTEIQTFKIKIPEDEIDLFVENYLSYFANEMTITGRSIQWEQYQQADPPIPCLYLMENEGELQAELRFRYGEIITPYLESLPAQTVVRKPGASWTLIRLERQPEAEENIYRSTSTAANGLKFGKIYGMERIFVLRARTDVVDFLMFKIPTLLEQGFEIYGEESLKKVRVNRSQPNLSLNITSGIDWFDLKATVQFGDQEVPLKDIRRALRKNQSYIKLADGSMAHLPEAWLKKYQHLFNLAEMDDHTLRLDKHHIFLLDQMLLENEDWQTDEDFRASLERFKGLENFADQPLPDAFSGELYPYQKAGYNWLHFLYENRFGGCLADDMGLGKTIQILAFLQSHYETDMKIPASLIVVPRSLLVNWQREAERFTPNLKVLEYFGSERQEVKQSFADTQLVITTYGVMMRDIVELRKHDFHYVVLDESQAIKNPNTKTAKAARLLNSQYRLTLTGTPVENNVLELWSQFAFLNPGLLGSLQYFRSEFGQPITQGDEQTTSLLRKMVYPFILRRTKQQVMPELPPKTERVLYTDMKPAQRKFYIKTRDEFRAQLLGLIEEEGIDKSRMKVLEGLLRLRQICNHPKLVQENFRGSSAKLELLLNQLETLQEEGHKALIFSQFVQMLSIVRQELEQRKIPYLYLDGRTRKRQERVDQFQTDDDIPFFLISLKAGGTGLNLTAADYVIHIDPWWNPAVEMQATDRAHRIGQDKPVFVYKLIAKDSVEEKIVELQEQKKQLVEQLITTESSFFKNLTQSDIEVLFS